MEQHNTTPLWMQDELVRDIPAEKLEFLRRIHDETHMDSDAPKNQKEMMMRLMPLLKQAKSQNLNFTPQEMQVAMTAIRKYSTPEELHRMDKIYAKHMNSDIP